MYEESIKKHVYVYKLVLRLSDKQQLELINSGFRCLLYSSAAWVAAS